MHDATAPDRTGAFRIVAIVLSLAFFLTPYLFTFGGAEIPGKDRVIGAELAGDGLALIANPGVLRDVQTGTVGLAATLTEPWWGTIHPEKKLWRPVPMFMLGLAGKLSGVPYDPANPGNTPLPYHLLTLAFHVLATMLLFDLALELTRSSTAALIAGALFATLPVHSEAILDVAGIAELSAAAFAFGAWTFWLRAGPKPFEKPGLLIGSLALVGLAALSKESAFALPLIFFIVDAGRNQKGALNFKAAISKLPAFGAMIAVLLVVLVARYSVLGSLTSQFIQPNELDNPLLAVGMLERNMNALRLMAAGILVMFTINPLRGPEGFHIQELFGFSSDYSASQVNALPAFSTWNLVGAGAILCSIVLAFLWAKKKALGPSLWLGMLAAMLITSNLLFPIGTVFAERLFYLPSGLLVILVALGLARFGKAGIAVGLGLAIAGGSVTMARAGDWTDPGTLIRATKDDAPMSAKTQFMLGLDLAQSDLPGLAIDRFQKALDLFPDYAAAEGNLGLALYLNLEYTEALGHLIRDLEIQLESADWQYSPEAYGTQLGPAELLATITNLRVYNAAVNQPQENLDWLDGLLQKGYKSPHVYALRGRNLLKLGRIQEADASYRSGLQIEPTFVGVRYLGELLRKTNRSEEALALYAKYIDDQEHFVLTDRIEFMLQLADTQLVETPLKAIETLERVKAFRTNMNPEQNFRLQWTWAQAALDTMPSEPEKHQEVFAEIERRLKNAMVMYSEVNDITYSARYALVTVFIETGNFQELVSMAEEMLQFRSAPVLRTRLAMGYEALGETDKALENWRTATEELIDEDGEPIDVQALSEARHGLVSLLSREDRFDEVEAAFERWQTGSNGDIDAWALALSIDWATGWGDLELAEKRAIKLRNTMSDFPQIDQLVDQIKAWNDPEGSFRSAIGLAKQQLNWGNFEGAASSAQIALERASSTIEKAEASGPLASARANLGQIEAALAAFDAALALDLPDAFKLQIQTARDQLSPAK